MTGSLPSQESKERPQRGFLLWFAVFLALVYLLSLRWEPPLEDVVGARWTSSDSGQPTELVARGWVPTNKVRYDETLRFWISLENRSSSDALHLRLMDFQTTPGFAAVGRCWRNSAPACIEGPAARTLPAVLKPRETVTVWATLEPAAKSGRYSPSAVVSWSSPDSGELRKGISLGPIEVTTWWQEAILLSARRLHMLVRDVALPLLVVVVGFLYQRREKKREDLRTEEEQRLEKQRRAEEKRLEEQRRVEQQRAAEIAKEADEFRAQSLQTWGQLLQQFLEDARRHYIPINSRLSTLTRVTRQHMTGDVVPVREHLFYLLTLLRQVRHLVESIGGFLFKDRGGEDVASLTWEAFLLKVDARFGSARRWQAMEAIKIREGLTQFELRFAQDSGDPPRSLLIELEKEFGKWRDDPTDPFHRLLPLLDLFYRVSAFEINRPFRYWYGRPEPFPAKTLRATEKALPADTLAALRETLEEYLRNEERAESAQKTLEADSSSVGTNPGQPL